MAAIHLANAVGGILFLGFISAVAFATILAVVAGLTLAGASAVSHDLYAEVIAKGRSDETEGGQHLEDLRRRDRHRRHHPGLHLREPERRLHGGPGLRGRRELQLPGPADGDVLEGHAPRAAPWSAASSGCSRAVSMVVLIQGGLGADLRLTRPRIFPYDNPALFSMTIAFVGIWAVSKLDSSAAGQERTGLLRRAVRAVGDRDRRRLGAYPLRRGGPAG